MADGSLPQDMACWAQAQLAAADRLPASQQMAARQAAEAALEAALEASLPLEAAFGDGASASIDDAAGSPGWSGLDDYEASDPGDEPPPVQGAQQAGRWRTAAQNGPALGTGAQTAREASAVDCHDQPAPDAEADPGQRQGSPALPDNFSRADPARPAAELAADFPGFPAAHEGLACELRAGTALDSGLALGQLCPACAAAMRACSPAQSCPVMRRSDAVPASWVVPRGQELQCKGELDALRPQLLVPSSRPPGAWASGVQPALHARILG